MIKFKNDNFRMSGVRVTDTDLESDTRVRLLLGEGYSDTVEFRET